MTIFDSFCRRTRFSAVGSRIVMLAGVLLGLASSLAQAQVPLSGVQKIAAGGGHTCALNSAGAVQCWGFNGNGQLGDSTTTQRLVPTPVPSLTSGVTRVAAGGSHTCAVTSGGAVQCWGDNNNGQLGDNTTTNRLVPTAVPSLTSGVTVIAAGNIHTCALTSGGAVQCWGFNGNGGLGDGTTTQRLVPTAIPSLTSGVTAIAAGAKHTCALTSGGAVQCWGNNFSGQLGDGSTTQRLVPTAVPSLTAGVTAIAAGANHTCALTSGGAVQCWGYNNNGQLGDGTTTNRVVPTAVPSLASSVTAIAARSNGAHTCAVTSGGAVQCWGFNGSGQLGDSTTTQRLVPTAIPSLTAGVSAIAVGGTYTCALTSGGAVQCWGYNGNGQLGDSTTTQRLVPTPVPSLTSGVTRVAAGGSHTCAVTSGGAVQCWGYNGNGQLGDNTTTNRLVPTAVPSLTSGVTVIAAGNIHTCALISGGAVQCWGNNANGQLGDNTTTQRHVPTAVPSLTSGVTAIGAGQSHSCALTSGGAMQCWGLNANGQLGDNTTTNRLVPTAIPSLTSGVTAIAAGANHTCALTSGGAVQCWGYNFSGQLGDGSTTQRLVPTAVPSLTAGVTAITAGGGHTCALNSAGAVQCWGFNGNGQLGDSTTTQRLVPTPVPSLTSGVTAIAAQSNGAHTCALTSGGAVQCWGQNTIGQLGDSTTTQRSVPTAIPSLSSGVTAIAAGSNHTCALTSGGAMQCWGSDGDGQIGDGTVTNGRPFPAPVIGFFVPGAPTIGAAAAGNAQATVAFTAPASDGGSAITSYTATSNPGSITGSCTAPCTSITVMGLTNGTTYTFTVTATNSIGTSIASSASNSVTPVGTQTVTFTPATPVVFGVGPIMLTATASSGLTAFTFSTSSANTICTVSGDQLTIVGVGTCALTATQAGNASFTGATANANVVINQTTPSLAITGNGTSTVGSNVTFTATLSGGASATGTVDFKAGASTITGCGTQTLSSNVATCSSNTLPVGSAAITAVYTGDTNNAGTTSAGVTHTVNKVSTTTALSSNTNPSIAGNAVVTFTATVTGSSPTGTINFKSGGTTLSGCGAVALSAGSATCLATFTTTGTKVITADYSGNTNNAISTGTLSGGQGVDAPTITLAPLTLPGGTVNATYSQSITASGGTATYTYAVTAGSVPTGLTLSSAGLLNGTATAGGSFSFTVTATDANGFTGAQAYSVTINPGSQTVTFAPATPVTFGATAITLSATASSGLTSFTFSTSSASSICTVSGNLLTITGGGTCALTATQPGDANYNGAFANADVLINPATQTVTFAPATPVAFGVSSIALTATASSGLTGFTFSTSSANTICTVSGNQLTIVGVGTCALTASEAGNANYTTALANASVVIDAANQTVTFGAAPSIPKNTTGTVSATSANPNSGNPIVFTSLTPGVCSVSGSTVTGLAVGTCVIAANQAGNTNFNAAAQVTQNITISGALCRLDVDGDDTHSALIDGQLLIRHLLGISGPSLVAAIPAFPFSAQRTTDGVISSYLNTLDLDIDGSGGAPLAATDGMIVLRAMLGFSGAAVTAGLPIPVGALRSDWTTIGPYLSGTCLMPVAP